MHRFLSNVIDVLGKRCLRGQGPRGADWLNPPAVQPRVLGEAGIRQSRGDARDAGERAPSLGTVCFEGLLNAIGQIPDSQRNKPDSEDLGSLPALNVVFSHFPIKLLVKTFPGDLREFRSPWCIHLPTSNHGRKDAIPVKCTEPRFHSLAF